MNHLFKTTTQLLLGAVALSAALIGCQKVPDNPTFDPETKTVTAQFVLNIATGKDTGTKMTATAVQKADNFLGISDAKLLTFSTGTAATNLTAGNAFVSNPAVAATKMHDLGNLYSSALLTPTGTDNANNQASSSHRVVDLQIPIQTDAILFYAKATNSNAANGNIQGKMTSHIEATPSNTYFLLEPRIGNQTNSYYETARLIAKILNYISHSSVNAQSGTESQDGYSGLGALTWAELGHQYEINHSITTGTYKELKALEEQLGAAYSATTTIKAGEYRSASAVSITNVMKELAGMALAAKNATPNFAAEANAKRLAIEIYERITDFFDSTNGFVFKNGATIKSNAISKGVVADEAAWNNAENGFSHVLSDMNKFPKEAFHIPVGAAQLAFNHTTDEFSYQIPNQALVNQVNKFQPHHYLYPAELAYYTNSAIRVTDKEGLAESSYPNGTSTWNNTSSWTTNGWAFGKVLSTTRGVAVRNNINYGVALLKTSVAWKEKKDDNTANLTYLEDNREFWNPGEGNNHLPINNSADPKRPQFELTGILVGGQNDMMDWQFLKKTALPTTLPDQTAGNFPDDHTMFNYVVYDDYINSTDPGVGGGTVPTTSGKENYTLLFDNYDPSLADNATQNSVYVALEFKNNGDPFWGKENIIPKDGTFYLLAKLDPTTLADSAWPTDHQVPPLNANGTSKKITRVFIQDFMTTAVFRIGQTTLQHAYVSVPNLASTQMSLGLSVDLSWTPGLSFDVELNQH